MLIHQYLKRGISHENFCEDYVFILEIESKYLIAGVLDGCSGGTESYFASAIFGKAIKNFAKNLKISDFKSSEEVLKHLVYKTITNIKCFAERFFINTDELLSTLIILVLDIAENKGNILCTGDGFVSINGENFNIDQNNIPDYLAYHFKEINNIEEFENWYVTQQNNFYFPELKDITISTDGINSFIKENKNFEFDEDYDVIDFLTNDTSLLNNKSMLGRKVNILKNKYGLTNSDDLGIVRICMSE